MSGAAVFAGHLLVGVVAEHHLPEGDGSLTVVPITWAEQLPAADRECLLLALGVESVAGMEVLTAGAPAHRWASVLPDQPAVLVERPGMLTSVRRALRTSGGNPVLIAGMGGVGKSVLAAQLARAVRDSSDAELAVDYPAGVAWVTVGGARPVAAIQLELARAFGEDQPDLGGDWRSGRARLQQLATGRRGLLVLDDVWTQDRYEPFRLAAPGVQILITTRNQGLAAEIGGVAVSAGELEKDQSRELLAALTSLPPAKLPAEADDLLALVGDLALGVAMVGAIARERGPRAWPGLLRRLRERQLEKIAHKFADNYEHATLLRAVEVAVDDLHTADQQRWAELAVFAGQGDVPESTIAALWHPFDQDDLDAEDRIVRFLARSLLQGAGDGRYRLHALQYDVAFIRLGAEATSAEEALAQTHARLADSYAQRVAAAVAVPPQAGWAELIAALARKTAADPAWRVADDGYLLDHIIGHLRRSGRAGADAGLLAGYDWIAVGLARRGLAGLASDYDGLPTGDPLRLVHDALSRSRRALSADHSCLPDQLLGRLAETEHATLAPLLARVKSEQARRSLQIIRSGLQRPSGSLIHVLTSQDELRALAVTADGTRAVTVSDSETVVVWDLATGQRLHTLSGHLGRVNAVAVTGDAARAVAVGSRGIGIVWNLATGTLEHTLTGRHRDDIQAVAVTADGTRVITADMYGIAVVWDLATGQQLHILTGHEHQIWHVAVTGDGTRVVTAGYDGTAIVWDLATGSLLHTLAGHQSLITAVAVIGDGTRAVTAGADRKAIVWDLATGQRLHTLTHRHDWVWAVAVLADGTRAVTAGGDGIAIEWNLATGKRLHTLTGHHDSIYAVAVTGDGTRAVTAGADRTAIVWDLATGTPLHALTGHHDEVNRVAIIADGTRAVTASRNDRTAIVWDLATVSRPHPDNGHHGRVQAIAIAGNGTRAVTASVDGTAIVWDLATGSLLHTLAGHKDQVRAVAVTGDGTRAVTASEDGTAIVWDLATGSLLHTLAGHQHWLRAVAVTDDGALAVTTSADRTAIMWDLASGELMHTFVGHTDQVVDVAVTGGGTQVVTASSDGTAIVWDLAVGHGHRLRTLVGHRGYIYAVAVTGDGTRAITAGYDGTAIAWDLTTGAQLHTLAVHQGPVNAVAVTADGTRAVSISDYGPAIVWDLDTGARLHTLTGHQLSVNAVAVTADGTRAATASDDETAIVWDLDTGQLIATWYGDAAMSAIAWAQGKPTIVAGDSLGAVHILRLNLRHQRDRSTGHSGANSSHATRKSGRHRNS
jgi:WD40 repeat protein